MKKLSPSTCSRPLAPRQTRWQAPSGRYLEPGQTFKADVADGEFNLDESANGVDLDAVWTGVPQACGNEFQGTRRPAEGRPSDEPTLRFWLKKTPGWN